MKISSQPELLQKDMVTAMNKRLSFADQFNTFVVTVDISAGDAVTIPNKLINKNGKPIIPGSWQVVDSVGTGSGSLGRSSAQWTDKQLFLTNYSANDGTFTIRFFERGRDEI